MRSLVVLLLTAAPALAHPGHDAPAIHAHESYGLWVGAAAFAVGLALSIAAVVKTARVKA